MRRSGWLLKALPAAELVEIVVSDCLDLVWGVVWVFGLAGGLEHHTGML